MEKQKTEETADCFVPFYPMSSLNLPTGPGCNGCPRDFFAVTYFNMKEEVQNYTEANFVKRTTCLRRRVKAGSSEALELLARIIKP